MTPYMKAINKSAAKVLHTLIAGLNKPGDARKIDNGRGFMAVHVEQVEPDLFSVAHYGEKNGDLMRDPEMVFWKGPDGQFYPSYYRNDYVGVERNSIDFDGGKPKTFRRREQADQAIFAGTWLQNIREQQGL